MFHIVHSLPLKHLSLPFHSFVPRIFIVPLNRNFSFIFPTSLFVRCNHSNIVEPFPPLPQYPSVAELSQRVYADYSVYTAKGVLTLTPKPPEFESKASGAFGVSREGYMLLQFAPSVGTEESIYDWNQKQVFSLSVSEMGTLICLGAMESWEFSRKTAKAKSNGIEVRKVLKVEPLLDATSHSFSLSVYKKPANMEEIEENIYLPITRAQLAVLRSIFNYIVPYLLGWNAFASTIKAEVYSQMNSANPRYSANNEWSR
ncbi:Single-stranded DNA-binding protein [Vigna angularis]|uniref:Single-stranded DNA-binding protein n=2 Tax=Phaseolus angularis TaxID=3914 RepID=A0A8T0JTQ0_PHAAN|nr:single-stranded DNA-binding protein WHY1, chloroplastic [Vigna angularis]KAG2383864.1 Single-stranded DNA-binding protein [Vigna angularis]BAU00933.1 hypothetical protein VIGAN_11007300 [Vigna angularis var. angularis]